MICREVHSSKVRITSHKTIQCGKMLPAFAERAVATRSVSHSQLTKTEKTCNCAIFRTKLSQKKAKKMPNSIFFYSFISVFFPFISTPSMITLCRVF